jgi:uncharacterized integral membrane protein
MDNIPMFVSELVKGLLVLYAIINIGRYITTKLNRKNFLGDKNGKITYIIFCVILVVVLLLISIVLNIFNLDYFFAGEDDYVPLYLKIVVVLTYIIGGIFIMIDWHELEDAHNEKFVKGLLSNLFDGYNFKYLMTDWGHLKLCNGNGVELSYFKAILSRAKINSFQYSKNDYIFYVVIREQYEDPQINTYASMTEVIESNKDQGSISKVVVIKMKYDRYISIDEEDIDLLKSSNLLAVEEPTSHK